MAIFKNTFSKTMVLSVAFAAAALIGQDLAAMKQNNPCKSSIVTRKQAHLNAALAHQNPAVTNPIKSSIVTRRQAHLQAQTNEPINTNKRLRPNQNLPDEPVTKKPRLSTTKPVKSVAESKNISEIFGPLACKQNIYINQKPSSIKTNWDRQYWPKKKKAEKNLPLYSDFFKNTAATKSQSARLALEQIITNLESNIQGFIDYLYANDFVTTQLENADNDAMDLDDVASIIERYNKFLRLFFLPENTDTNEYMFTVANNFFQYCFGTKTYPNFKKYLNNENYFPILRLIYSVINEWFSASGWNDWSFDCLVQLKEEADRGKTIYYIAGGCDIHHLIDSGIYNITIIDPFLPSQEKFYVPGWEWFVKNANPQNGIGDTIIFDKHKIMLKRVTYKEDGTFNAKLSTGKKCKIPQSETVWKVTDMEKKDKHLGYIKIQRRFCNENDFLTDPQKAVLISFNELYCIATTDEVCRWGLDVSKINAKSEFYIKQLHKPVSTKIIHNMHDAEDENIKFQFCKLGCDAQ